MNKFITMLLLFACVSCKKENMGDCFKSTGKIKTEHRNIKSFTSLELNDRINVFLTYSPQLSLTVEAGEKLQAFIITEVKGGRLIIRNDNRCNWVRSFKKEVNVFLSTPTLTNISYYGSGELTYLNTFVTDSLLLNMWESSGNLSLKLNANYVELKTHTGPGTVTCEGTTEQLVGFVGATGFIDATKMASKRVLAVASNTGTLKVNASEFLNAQIRSDGNIHYLGNPIIELIDNGDGNLIKIDE